MPGTHEPGDHKHRPAEKPPALGTFPKEFELEVCVRGARRFTNLNGELATAGSPGRASRSEAPSEEDEEKQSPGWPGSGTMFLWLFGEGTAPRSIVRSAPSEEK